MIGGEVPGRGKSNWVTGHTVGPFANQVQTTDRVSQFAEHARE
jgi:hypothetical protein